MRRYCIIVRRLLFCPTQCLSSLSPTEPWKRKWFWPGKSVTHSTSSFWTPSGTRWHCLRKLSLGRLVTCIYLCFFVRGTSGVCLRILLVLARTNCKGHTYFIIASHTSSIVYYFIYLFLKMCYLLFEEKLLFLFIDQQFSVLGGHAFGDLSTGTTPTTREGKGKQQGTDRPSKRHSHHQVTACSWGRRKERVFLFSVWRRLTKKNKERDFLNGS